MARLKYEKKKATVVNIVSMAYGELASLAEECREIVDNASEGLQQTQRIQTFDETAGTLENFNETAVPESIAAVEMEYEEWTNTRKGRGLSRSDRCAWACSLLESLSEAYSEKEEDFCSELDDTRGDAEGCEFPGMYG